MASTSATAVTCPHEPWLSEFWLCLAVISNANGSVLFMTRFFKFPYSWFASVAFIIVYRFVFRVKVAMPIALDLSISLFCQFLIASVKSYSWEIAVTTAFILNLSLFHGGYFSTHLHQEYLRLKKINPKKKPAFSTLIQPLSVELLFRAMIVVHIFQGFFFVLTWCFPFNDGLYKYYQMFIGYFMVDQSVTFLNCYKEITDKASSAKKKASDTLN